MNLHTLFAQLQARYPSIGLITEVVQNDTNHYIVRAIAQVSGTPLATSLAGAATVEQAEDQARLRLMELLGIGSALNGASATALVPPAQVSNQVSNSALPVAPLATANSWANTAPSAPISLEVTPEPVLSAIPSLDSTDSPPPFHTSTHPSPGLTTEEEGTPLLDLPLETSSNSIVYEPEFYPEPEDFSGPETYTEPEDNFFAGDLEPPAEEPAPAKPTKPSRSKASKAEAAEKKAAEKTTEPDDLSSLIAMTDVEMDRVGWSKKQGRDYLRRTYSKQTRQELEVDELLDFLNYLRALPSTNGL